MKEITAASNKNVKLCVQLASKKYRDALGLYLIEGFHLLDEAVKCGADIQTILLREDVDQFDGGAFGQTYKVEEKLFARISHTETSQGILAIVSKKIWSEDEFFEKVAGKNILVLDRVQDPGNIGTMIRTADAAGFGGAVIVKGCGDIYAPKVVRSAAGSLFRLPVLLMHGPGEAMAAFQKYGKRVIGAAGQAEKTCYEVSMGRHTALLIGNEGGGLCREFLQEAHALVRIPMSGNIESLNAAVAAGILMYECVRNKYTDESLQ